MFVSMIYRKDLYLVPRFFSGDTSLFWTVNPLVPSVR